MINTKYGEIREVSLQKKYIGIMYPRSSVARYKYLMILYNEAA